MSTHPRRLEATGWAPIALRVFLYSLIVAGVGMVAALGGNLVLTATATANASGTKSTLEPKAAAAVQIVHPPTGGTLVIAGGGKLPKPIRERFCKLAGGADARILVIPTATGRADNPVESAQMLEDWKACGVKSVRLLHTRSRLTANDPNFVKPIREATGVWLSGGNQVYLTQAYLGTEVERELNALLCRGGVVGGTSAGAAVMTRVMIAGGQTKADVTEGFGFLSGAVVDQHFLKRNRIERLLGVISTHPNLVGLGIDEQTALVVDVREHHLSVLGDSYVVACVPDSDHRSVRLKFLKSGDQTDLAELKTPTAAPTPALGLGSL